MEAPTVASLATTAGLAVATLLIVNLIWATAKPTAAVKDQFGPLTAVIVGCILALLAVFFGGVAAPAGANGSDVINALLAGLFVGTTSMGIHDAVNSAGVKV